jgi:outer membrane protein assembly factor BamA
MNRFCDVASCVIVISTVLAAQPPATSASDDQITVKELVITGVNDLSSSQIAEAKDSVVGKSGTTENLMDAARHSLTAAFKSDCYLSPDIELFSAFRKDEPPDAVVMHATVHEGLRYTLRNFGIQWAKAASLQEIEQLLPIADMRRGDCRGLDDVPSTVQDFYQKRGYPNVKVHPRIQLNGATRQFDLTLYIDEGSRSR